MGRSPHYAPGALQHHPPQRDCPERVRIRELDRTDQAEEDLRHQHSEETGSSRTFPLHRCVRARLYVSLSSRSRDVVPVTLELL